ncbi:MAG: coproporphyrinogen dehydrogenase HemZ [Ruminococcus sp.]|nr:coproporphyrinogen dehydrogenase HemZ [Ruminococcus sp.]
MNLYIDNHSFHYEMENLTRAFLFDEKIIVIREWEKTEQPYILTSVCDRIEVKLCAGDFSKSLFCERGEDDELSMAQLLYALLSEYTGRTLPWGLLTGVRPVKLFSKLADESSLDEAKKYFSDALFVSEGKIRLCEKVYSAQKEIISRSDRHSFSLYVSIPFCPTRCSYCSFVSQSIERAKKLIDDYIPLLCEEIRYTAEIAKELELRLESVYIGGGTPTTLTARQLRVLLAQIRACFDTSNVAEFTVEAGRPDTVTREKLLALKEANVTRISINPQTFNDDVLSVIGRKHTSQQTKDAFLLAGELGFDNINMDFIAGLPTESVESFENSIRTALSLDPESITVHTLAVKKSARLTESDTAREFSRTADMLSFVENTLPERGYTPYYLYRQSKMLSNLENIGWAKEGCFSPYNIYIMEETHSILACGAGAVTKLRDVDSNYLERIFNFKYPYEYISRFDEMLQRKERIKTFYQEYNL